MVLRRSITYETGVSAEGFYPLAGRRLIGALVNISNGGLCFKTRYRLQKQMVLKVSLPVGELLPIAPTLTQVLWIVRDPRQNGYRTGVRFII